MVARAAGRPARLRSLLAAAAALSALLGCARPGPSVPPGFIQIDLPVSPINLDPRIATDAMSQRVGELLYDSLVRVAPDGHFAGDLAQTIERPSPTEIIFHLRRGVRFSDGRVLTAADVVFTYESFLDPASLSPKRALLDELASITAVDDYTVAMTTRSRYAPALEMAAVGIVPAGSPIPGNAAPVAPPGSGPFALLSLRRDESVLLARNRYRPASSAAVRGIFFKIVPDPTVRVLELTEGACDFTENDGLQPELIPFLKARPAIQIVKSPGSTYQYLIFNFRDPRLRDLRVRRAIAYAIDRNAIVTSMLRGNARVATGLLAPENWAYDGEVTRYPFDSAAARSLLEGAGYSPEANPLRLVYKTTPEGRRLAEAIQGMLRPVGISIEVHTNEFATFIADLRSGNFDLASAQWVGVGDPHEYYEIFDSRMTPERGGNNRGHYANPAMDRLVEAGEVELDPVARRQLYAQVQRLAAADLPYVSLWWNDNVAAFNRRLDGFQPFPNGSLTSLAGATLAR